MEEKSKVFCPKSWKYRHNSKSSWNSGRPLNWLFTHVFCYTFAGAGLQILVSRDVCVLVALPPIYPEMALVAKASDFKLTAGLCGGWHQQNPSCGHSDRIVFFQQLVSMYTFRFVYTFLQIYANELRTHGFWIYICRHSTHICKRLCYPIWRARPTQCKRAMFCADVSAADSQTSWAPRRHLTAVSRMAPPIWLLKPCFNADIYVTTRHVPVGMWPDHLASDICCLLQQAASMLLAAYSTHDTVYTTQSSHHHMAQYRGVNVGLDWEHRSGRAILYFSQATQSRGLWNDDL